MKKILISLMAIALVIGLVGAGTAAWFSDTETSGDNIFTAGTVEISLTGDAAVGVVIEDIAPGDTVSAYLRVENDGSLPLWFAGYIDSISVSEPLFSTLWTATVTTDPDDYYGYEVEIYSGPLAGLLGAANALIDDEYPPLPPGQYAGYTLELTLDGPGTGNEYQGASMTIVIGVNAVQSDNIGWDAAKALLTTP